MAAMESPPELEEVVVQPNDGLLDSEDIGPYLF